jgi:hypothetical protein
MWNQDINEEASEEKEIQGIFCIRCAVPVSGDQVQKGPCY